MFRCTVVQSSYNGLHLIFQLHDSSAVEIYKNNYVIGWKTTRSDLWTLQFLSHRLMIVRRKENRCPWLKTFLQRSTYQTYQPTKGYFCRDYKAVLWLVKKMSRNIGISVVPLYDCTSVQREKWYVLGIKPTTKLCCDWSKDN